MGYQMNMNEEKEPKLKILLPKGWQKFIIKKCYESKSKAGNVMFIFDVLHVKSNSLLIDEIYAVATPGKRWFLKSILSVCGISASEDGNYSWDIPDVIDKEFMGFVEHEDNQYYNREGTLVQEKVSRIIRIKSVGEIEETIEELYKEEESVTTSSLVATSPDEIQWVD